MLMLRLLQQRFEKLTRMLHWLLLQFVTPTHLLQMLQLLSVRLVLRLLR
jgi:hypothetical protein